MLSHLSIDETEVSNPEPAEKLHHVVWQVFQQRLRACQWRWQRQRQRRALARLLAHELDDVGISPEQARAEAAKPFWRD